MAQAPLGEFEVVVLMAVLQRGDDAYGTTIIEEIGERTGRRVSRGSVYVTLDRLEQKHLLTSRLDGVSAARGGRPKRLFHATSSGIRAVRHSVSTLSRMKAGLEPLLGDS